MCCCSFQSKSNASSFCLFLSAYFAYAVPTFTNVATKDTVDSALKTVKWASTPTTVDATEPSDMDLVNVACSNCANPYVHRARGLGGPFGYLVAATVDI